MSRGSVGRASAACPPAVWGLSDTDPLDSGENRPLSSSYGCLIKVTNSEHRPGAGARWFLKFSFTTHLGAQPVNMWVFFYSVGILPSLPPGSH